ncbi:MAG TPA: membrane protein insertase YidC [Kofleriaceae bacterium]|nr:membrane protein insertase YidC [Kofleriaceae bacterium]
MQDQGKRLLLVVALSAAFYLVWITFAKHDEPVKPGQTASQTTSQTTTGSAAAPAPGQAAAVPQIGPPAASPGEQPAPTAAATISLPFDRFVATFSSTCGGLTSWQLTDERYRRDTTKGELMPVRANMTAVDSNGKPPSPAQLANLPACGAFDVNFVTAASKYVVPRGAVWRGEKVSPTEVRYTYGSPSEPLEIVKDFTLVPRDYLVRMTVKVVSHAADGREANEQLAVTAYAYQDPAELKNGSSRVAARAWSSATLRPDDNLITTDVAAVIEWPRFEPAIRWTGYDHPYLLAGYAPQDNGPVAKHTSAADGTKGLPRGFMRTDLVFPSSVLRPGESLSRTVVAYLGPKNYDDLHAVDASAGFQTGFDKVIDLGWFAFIGRPLLWLLQKFQSVVGNWGIAIILLTIVVKLLTLYWTTQSMRSMKETAALAPQLKALQAKYADDKQRQQAEQMALYKEHGVNPVAGCLPMLLQMPIWIALYRMLANAGELYLQPFIPGWIGDLTATDPYYILPGVLFVSMFLQTRLQPASVDSTQQKFLQYGMPIMFGGMALFFPSGLTLYMFTNNVLSALHSIYMNKFDKRSLAAAAKLKKNQEFAAQATAAAAKPTGAAAQAASSAKNPAKKNGAPAARRVIDAKATEVPAAQAAAGEESDDAPEGAASPGAGAARNRPRRKKRRR